MEAFSGCQSSISMYLLYPLIISSLVLGREHCTCILGQLISCPAVCAWWLQAYSAAVQSQLQWMKQLCLCVEQHMKENTAYFQVCGLSVFLCVCLCVTVCVCML